MNSFVKPSRFYAVMVSVLVSTVIGTSMPFITIFADYERFTLFGIIILSVLPAGIRLSVVNSIKI